MDFYETLGVSREATKEEITNAYRASAMKYHPDRNPKNPDATQKFKQASAAHEVLSDESKRAQYDRQISGFRGFRQRVPSGEFFDNVFSQFLGGERPTIHGTRVRLDITLEESFTGCSKSVQIHDRNLCKGCQGSGISEWIKCEMCEGQGFRSITQSGFTLKTGCNNCGCNGQIPLTKCSDCKGQGFKEAGIRSVKVEVPCGIEDNSQIRIPESGMEGTDLYVVIKVKKHDLYERQGRHLYRKLAVSYPEMVMGSKIKLNTLGGEAEFKIRPGTQNGVRIRLAEQGMPMAQNPKVRGDLFLILEVRVPQSIDKEEEELLSKLLKKKQEKGESCG